MKTDRYTVLAERGQDWARLVANLRRIENAVASIPLEPFFEPLAELVRQGKDQPFKLAVVTAPHLNAWTRHVAYGTIVRLTELTGPCLELLGTNQLIAAGLVARQLRQAIHGVCRVAMFVAEYATPDLEGFDVERLGLCVLAFIRVKLCQIGGYAARRSILREDTVVSRNHRT
jgi:hypothetical protein